MTAARPLAVAAALAASLLGGCAMPTVPTIQPWVKPYERERLGDPIMKLSRDALPDKHFEHVRDRARGRARRDRIPGGRLWLQLRRRSASGDACWRCSAACSAACSASPGRAPPTCPRTRPRR